ncbi:MAG: 16S rRNA (uracil(1498)-N(3))-methyltransferase [Anaerolineae bacterium]
MHRFFVPPNWIKGDTVTISGSVVHQIRDVLRLKPGDNITVLDDSGWEYQVRLATVEQAKVTGQIEQKVLARTEPRTKITLYQSLLKGDKFEWILQKGTELGVVEFVPVVSDRCVIGSVDDVSKAKFERWQKITLEAAEQSRRARLPRLHVPLLFPQACERARRADLAVLPWEEEKARTLRAMLTTSDSPPIKVPGKNLVIRKPFSISIIVGPEGGFTSREVDQARRYGIAPVTLGPRILRAETAALAAIAIILYQLEDM